MRRASSFKRVRCQGAPTLRPQPIHTQAMPHGSDSPFRPLTRDWRFWRPGRRPGLRIIGVEVVQAIQHFDFNNPEANNSVPLVARKRTLARVYVEAAKPTAITGRVTIRSLGLGQYIEGVYGPGGAASVSVVVEPLAGAVAQPTTSINRGKPDSSLNFLLPPLALNGLVELAVEVRMHGWVGLLVSAQEAVQVEFQERRLPHKLVYMLAHNGGFPAPTHADYQRCLDQVIARFPAPDEDFDGVTFLPGHETIENTDDLSSSLLPFFSQLERILADTPLPPNSVLTVLLAYPGGTQAGSERPGSRLVVFDSQDTFPHELGHFYGLGHCVGDPGADTHGIPTNTEDIGVDMSSTGLTDAGAETPFRLMDAGKRETMSWLATVDTWCSVKSWELLFPRFKPPP